VAGLLGGERIEAAIAGRDAVDERGDAQRLEALLAHPLLELAHAAPPGERADAREADEVVGIVVRERRRLVVRGPERDGVDDARLPKLGHVIVQRRGGAAAARGAS